MAPHFTALAPVLFVLLWQERAFEGEQVQEQEQEQEQVSQRTTAVPLVGGFLV